MQKPPKLPPIGEVIREKVEKSGMTITEFAKKIHTSRRSVYQIFSKNSIDTDTLHNIAKVLGSDWIVEYFIQKYHYENPKMNNDVIVQSDELKKMMQQIDEQYAHLKRSINEIKAMQHYILEILESKK
jgi:plasmid maintenance system antidote protein VapI